VKSVQICTATNDVHQTHKPHFGVEKRRGFGDFLKPVLQRNILPHLQTADSSLWLHVITLLVLQ